MTHPIDPMPPPAAEAAPESPRLKALRLAWIRVGLPLLAIPLLLLLHGGMDLSALHLGTRGYGWTVAAFWCLAGIRAFFVEMDGRTTGPWVPRLQSLFIGLGLLIAGALGRMFFTGQYLSLPPCLGDARFLPFLCVWYVLMPAAMVFHTEAAWARTGSALFAWALAVPMIPVAASYPVRVLKIGLAVYQNGRMQSGQFLVLAGAMGVGIALALGLGWLGEILLTRGDRRPVSAGRGGLGLATRSLPAHWALTALPFLLAIFGLGRFGHVQLRPAIWRPDAVWLLAALVALFGTAILSFVVGLRNLGRREAEGGEWKWARLGVYGIVLSGALVFQGGFVADLPVLKSCWAIGAVYWMGLADWRDVLRERGAGRGDSHPWLPLARRLELARGRSSAEQADVERPETISEALRSLVGFPWSPLSRWGAPRRRWVQWAMPPLLWVFAFIALAGGILFGWRAQGRPINFWNLFRPSEYGSRLWETYLIFVFCFGVAAPIVVIIPWRIAGRFHQVWDPAHLRELALTRLSAWDIFWSVALGGVRPNLVFASMTLLFLALTATLRFMGFAVYRPNFGMANILFFALVPLVGGMLLSLLTIGFARRGKRAGLTGYGAGVITLIAGALGALMFARLFVIVPTELGAGGAFLFVVTIGVVQAFRFAFARVPETLQELVGNKLMAPSLLHVRSDREPGSWTQSTAENGPGSWTQSTAPYIAPVSDMEPALLDFHRSPLRDWGVPRSSRRLVWVLPPILWVTILVVIVASLSLYKITRHDNVGTMSMFLTSSIYREGLIGFYVGFLYVSCIFTPLLVFLPWKVAARFRDYWTPRCIAELTLTRLNPWEIFWAMAIPVARPYCILAGATSIPFSILFATMPLADQMGGELIQWGAAAILLEFAFLPGLFMTLLVIGFGQRRCYRGAMAFGAALLVTIPVQAAVFGGSLLLLEKGGPLLVGVVFPLASVIPLSWARKYAFHRAMERLSILAGE